MNQLVQLIETNLFAAMVFYGAAAFSAAAVTNQIKKKNQWRLKAGKMFLVFIFLWFSTFFLNPFLPELSLLALRSVLVGIYVGLLPGKEPSDGQQSS
ncbi:MAG: hypothetical protein ACYDG6_07345 [Thermincolia bacterium]